MDAMMYKIEGEESLPDRYKRAFHDRKFINTQLTEDQLPQTLTSYSPCFRKEKGAHGIEERGVYRIHQFEKQEMIVVCKPEDVWNGMINCGKIQWICSVPWISRCVRWNAVQETWRI